MKYSTPTGIIEASGPDDLIRALKSPWYTHQTDEEFIKAAAWRVWKVNGKFIGYSSTGEFISDMIGKGIIQALD